MTEKKKTYIGAFKAAFPYTIPVLTGYLFIGIAFGVMFQEKGYSFLWAALMSIIVYAGSAQYLAVNFFVPGISLLYVFLMILMVNIRHVFYGLTFLKKFHQMGKKKWYMIFSLTDETYSLLYGTHIPDHVDERKFLFAIALLDQCYWIAGSVIGAIAGSLIPFDLEGIEFAMTALFVVIFTEQWLVNKNHFPAAAGVSGTLLSLLIFGADNFIPPAMIIILAVLVVTRRKMEEREGGENDAG